MATHLKKWACSLVVCAVWLVGVSACQNLDGEKPQAIRLSFTFADSTHGWQAGFADYPVGEGDFYELDFVRTTLPLPLDTTRYALRIAGNNHSDDLFMFLKRKVAGLLPSQTYRLTIDLTLASDAPQGSVGIGGSPANSVYLKAGATPEEPKAVPQDGQWQLNVDKGQQSQGGADLMVLGDIATEEDDFGYALIQRGNRGQPFTFTTDEAGSAWIIVGTDSGFEGKTTLYYSQIGLEFEPMLNE